MTDFVITPTDLLQVRFCIKGTRAWAERHGFCWEDFVENGISAARVEATGDAMACELVKRVRLLKGAD